jgi:hypothetical protein
VLNSRPCLLAKGLQAHVFIDSHYRDQAAALIQYPLLKLLAKAMVRE